jgi:hypothetical protein
MPFGKGRKVNQFITILSWDKKFQSDKAVDDFATVAGGSQPGTAFQRRPETAERRDAERRTKDG